MGMRMLNVKMQTTVKRTDLLERIEANRDGHAKIVQEARAGYLVAAKKRVEEALAAINAGHVASLQAFALDLPQDYTSAYDTVIEMLKWSTDDVITLSADEFRQFVQDQWDWKDGFIFSNAGYSETARILSR